MGQFWAKLNVGNAKLQKTSSNASITDGNGNYSIAGATYGVFSDKDCTKQLATLTTDENGNTDVAEVKAGTVYIKQLMSEDEIAVMDGGKCILQLRGVRPFFSEKYDITKHPKYKYLSDFDKKNAFDMEKHLRRRPAIVKPDEVFDYYEVDEADLQEDAE